MKEIIKENTVNAPTLFVGVGGTGSKIIKRVAEKCGKNETQNVNFLVLDTNVNDLGNVASSGAKIYHIQTSNTQTVGNYLKYDDDARNNWFPKNAILYPKSVSEGAGQVRAISRLAMNGTIKTGSISPLYEAVDDLFRKDGSEMKQALRIVIVSTASGGTGSGLLLPLSMYIRDYVNGKYPNTTAIVRMMILLPETLDSVIKSTTERDSQRRNAYATIKELNAFMMKGSGFMEYNADLQRYNNLHVDVPIAGSEELKSMSLLPCDFCFLMDGQDSEDSTMVSMDQYMDQAAQALYEQNIGPMQKNAFSVEDNIIKEFSAPGIYGRNRFGGIGASVIRYPFGKVAEYIAYDWAISCVGGSGEAAKWTRYDKEYERKHREEEAKGLSLDDSSTRAQVYCEAMLSGIDRFSKDLRVKYGLEDYQEVVDQYIDALETEIYDVRLNGSGRVADSLSSINDLTRKISYEKPSNRGKALANYARLQGHEAVVRAQAQKVGESAANSIFYNEEKTANARADYLIEKVLKNSAGDVAHPNAVRYMLYQLKTRFEEERENNKDSRDNALKELKEFGSAPSRGERFDAAITKKDKEGTMREFCEAEPNPSDKETLSGTESTYYEALNKHLGAYYKAIDKYGKAEALYAVYQIGAEYLDAASKMFERFYATFAEKVTTMTRQQTAIAEGLVFHSGDSVLNICATREMLDELSSMTNSMSDSGAMLDSELNGKIFDAVKSNVIFEREVQNTDVVDDDRRVDIFDDILIGYFKDSVETNCENIDMNIIEAIAMERRLTARIKAREDQVNSGGKEKIYNKLDHDAEVRHIQETIAKGVRLAAPSIQKLTNTENREVNLAAYNKSLLDMQNYSVGEMLPKGTSGSAVDTISRYEMHFFNALYNLTADKLNKFACSSVTETAASNAGLYHNAYVSYSKLIGPDSTKSDSISTHIDKRWDSIAAMPELDFDFQRQQMMKVHQALIYALIYGAISYRSYSNESRRKMVYKYENSSEYYEDLVVSNGTPCDEFFEILDSLYISPNIVEDIEIVKKRKGKRDETRNSNYKDTQFAKELDRFSMKHEALSHEGKCSLFEIPLAYYNSLPASQRYSGEIAAMTEAVIQTFEDQLRKWEKENDVPFMLTDILLYQFNLLIDNYKANEKLSNGIAAADSEVIDIIFRKIRKKLGDSELIDSEEILLAMKDKISE